MKWDNQRVVIDGLPQIFRNGAESADLGNDRHRGEFELLLGVLPRDYGIFEAKVLEDLMRLFNSSRSSGPPATSFGRICEYFLAKVSIQKARDNGAFFEEVALLSIKRLALWI